MDNLKILLVAVLAATTLPGCALLPANGDTGSAVGKAPTSLSEYSDEMMASDLIDALTGLEDYFADGVDISANRQAIAESVSAYFDEVGIPTGQGEPMYIVVRSEQEKLMMRASYRQLQMGKNYGSNVATTPVRVVAGDEWPVSLSSEFSDGWKVMVPPNR